MGALGGILTGLFVILVVRMPSWNQRLRKVEQSVQALNDKDPLPTPASEPKNSPLPPGIVAAYAADIGLNETKVPQGWLPCTGAEYPIADFPELAQVLEGRYGDASAGHFRVPNYSGYFLRGLDRKQVRDKDKRDPSKPGAPDRDVGSTQSHTIAKHSHVPGNPVYEVVGGFPVYNPHPDGNRLTIQVGALSPPPGETPPAETRPSNVYVYFLVSTGR